MYIFMWRIPLGKDNNLFISLRIRLDIKKKYFFPTFFYKTDLFCRIFNLFNIYQETWVSNDYRITPYSKNNACKTALNSMAVQCVYEISGSYGSRDFTRVLEIKIKFWKTPRQIPDL